MAKRNDPAATLAWILHITALCTGAFLAQLLLLAVPALAQHRLWIMLSMMLLAWLAYFLWLKHEPDQPLPVRFGGYAKGACLGLIFFLSIKLLQLLTEPLVDLTTYEPLIYTVRLACPGLFGVIGALTYKRNKNEEDHNNG